MSREAGAFGQLPRLRNACKQRSRVHDVGYHKLAWLMGPQMCFCGEASGGGVMKQLVNKDKSEAVSHDGMTSSLFPLSQFGLGFWQAWWTLAFCTDTLVGTNSAASLMPDAHLFMFAITTFGYVATLALGRRGILIAGRKGRTIAALLCCAGSLGMAAATYLPASATLATSILFLLATVLFSLGNALLLCLWGELWSALASGKVGRCLYTSYIIAFVLFFIVSPLPVAARALILAVLPVISCAILTLSQDEPRRTPRRPTATQAIPGPLVARGLIAAFVLNFVWGLGLPALGMLGSAPDALTSNAGLAIALVLLVLLLAYMSVAQPVVEAFSLHGPVEVALAGGMLLALLLPGEPSVLGYGVTVLGGSCLDMLVMLVATDMAFKTGKPVAFILSLVMLVARVGSFIGRQICAALLIPGVLAPDKAVLVCVLATIVCGFWVFTRSTLEGLYRAAPAPQSEGGLEECCRAFAESHALTAREAEVLALLMHGRSAPYIAEKLSIAQGTAKNHISNIYRKVGVGDRQSLLNLVEQSGE